MGAGICSGTSGVSRRIQDDFLESRCSSRFTVPGAQFGIRRILWRGPGQNPEESRESADRLVRGPSPGFEIHRPCFLTAPGQHVSLDGGWVGISSAVLSGAISADKPETHIKMASDRFHAVLAEGPPKYRESGFKSNFRLCHLGPVCWLRPSKRPQKNARGPGTLQSRSRVLSLEETASLLAEGQDLEAQVCNGKRKATAEAS